MTDDQTQPTPEMVERRLKKLKDYLFRHQRADDDERVDTRDDLTFGDLRAALTASHDDRRPDELEAKRLLGMIDTLKRQAQTDACTIAALRKRAEMLGLEAAKRGMDVALLKEALEEARLIIANLPHDESMFLVKIDALLNDEGQQ